VTEASEKRSEQKEYDCRNTENSDYDCLDVARRLVDEGEDVHHVKENVDNTAAGQPLSRRCSCAG
jgi:hypothetical protein